MIQEYGRHRAVEELPTQTKPDIEGTNLIEHAVVQALMRAGFEIHGALSLVGEAGAVAGHLRDALNSLDKAVNETRCQVADRIGADARPRKPQSVT
jgi:hypothetical protein